MSDLSSVERLEAIGSEPGDYGFTFEPHPGRVLVKLGGVVLADSRRVMLMRETRLAPVHYFPRDDVNWAVLVPSDHHTHCPFKGDASYWSATVPGRTVEDVAWSYPSPLSGAEEIADYVAFYGDRVDGIYEDDRRISPARSDEDRVYDNPLLGWLLRDAPHLASAEELTEAFAERLLAADFSLWRLAVIIRTLHPQVMAVAHRWWAKRDGVEQVFVPYETATSPRFLNSPLVPIFEGAGGIRRRLDIPDPVLDFGILKELHDEGVTDYVAMPVPFLGGQINVLSLCSNRPGGFTTAELGNIYEILDVLGRLYELHTMRRTAVTLLDTYLGRHAGERVLKGLIKRGDGENIHAVIWFCDLRGSTPLAESMSREDFLGALNQFFDCMAGAVQDHGGQVLRFIGDAALAIFPVDEQQDSGMSAEEARARALQAAREARTRIRTANGKRAAKGWLPLEYGLALHMGEVTYGNIGTEERLEFTVIGDAANYAARLEGMCKQLGEPILASADFARHFGDRFVSLGRHRLAGLEEEQEIFALRS